MTRLVLPWPPSTNKYWKPANYKLVLTKHARKFRADALAAVIEQGSPRLGDKRLAVTVTIHPPDAIKRDVDNFGGKAVLDALAFARVFDNDSQIDDLRIVRGEVLRPDGQVIVLLEPYAGAVGVESP